MEERTEAQFCAVPVVTHGGRVYANTNSTADVAEVSLPAPRPNRRQRRRGAVLAQREHVKRLAGKAGRG